jgi:3-phosphoglycerate kinase
MRTLRDLTDLAGTVLWDGPMGAFELAPFVSRTRVVAEAIG